MTDLEIKPRRYFTRRRVIRGGLASLATGAGLYLIGGEEPGEQLSLQLNYDLNAVRRGATVPRIILPTFGGGLGLVTHTPARKDLFFRLMLPIVLAENEKIKDKTKRIPVSLVLAQAAIESGWGSARFTIEGNAVFGERIYGAEGRGIAPKKGTGAFRVRAFKTLSASVAAYMENLNTHPEYGQFRAARGAIWAEGRAPSGVELAYFLVSYSEERSLYAEKVMAVITKNSLHAFDGTKLEATP